MRRALALLFVSSCLFPDLGPLSGDDAGGGGDATIDVANDVSPDATNDVKTDVAPTDAGSDVKTSPCAVQHTFCDDFDDGSLGAGWNQPSNGVGGMLSQSTNAVTPPYALQAQVPGGPGHPYAYLEKDFPAASHIHFECDILIVGAQGTDMEIDYFDFSFTPAGYTYGDLNIERRSVGATIEEGSQTTTADASVYKDDDAGEGFTTWKHLAVDINFTTSTFAVAVNGATIDAMSMNPPLPSSAGTLAIGATYTGGLSSTWSVLIDNVVVDLQ